MGLNKIYASICIIIMYTMSPAFSDQSEGVVRSFPYPFENSVSFASDADLQRIEHGMSIHNLFNKELGLPISDSVFPKSSKPQSAFFLTHDDMNNEIVGGVPVYARLLREWHRGNIDHFHSWTEDAGPGIPLKASFPQPLRNGLALQFPPLRSLRLIGSSAVYDVLRLYFDALPPSDLEVRLRLKDGSVHTTKVRGDGDFNLVQFRRNDSDPIIVDIISPKEDGKRIDYRGLSEIVFASKMCYKDCKISLLKVERDNFSRLNAVYQVDKFENWAVRPFLYTSHGSVSYNQNYGKASPWIIADDEESREYIAIAEELADNPSRHSYLSDVLKSLGVGSVWSITDQNSYSLPGETTYNTRNVSGPFYNITRTWLGYFSSTNDMEEYIDKLVNESSIDDSLIREIVYCKEQFRCAPEQGTVLGLLAAESVNLIESGLNVDHLWYTHFGTSEIFGRPEFIANADNPFHEASARQFERLAELHYNSSGQVPYSSRTWVAPAGTAVRYRLNLGHAKENTRYDPNHGIVRIDPWIDPVLNITIPDPYSGTRDINGLTVYVDDSSRARVFIGETETDSFTRNPPDRTGRQSVTIVDDTAATVIMGRADLDAVGLAEATEGIREDGSDDAYPVRLISRDEGGARLEFTPWDVNLWNTTHIRWRYRKSGEGEAFVHFVLDDGRLLALEEGAQLTREADGGWAVAPQEPDVPVSTIVATATAEWRPAEFSLDESEWVRPPLPVGKIRKIIVGLRNAAPGAVLEIGQIAALRPDGTSALLDSRLVAGRVSRANGAGVPGVDVVALHENGTRLETKTDEFGLYEFHGIGNGALLDMSLPGHDDCAPVRGSQVEVFKNEAEIDFDLTRCRASLH